MERPKFSMFFILSLLVLAFTNGLDEDIVDNQSFEPGVGENKMKLNVAEAKAPRYLLYEVNHGEGFNLRRDVYMRMSILVHKLNQDSQPWVLVLPAWGRIYHWQSKDIENQERLPWSTFFDIKSLRRFVPVMEFEEFLKITPSKKIDHVFYLQSFKNWKKFEDKIEKADCDYKQYHLDSAGKKWEGWFFGFDGVWTPHFECLNMMGHAESMKPFLYTNATGRAVMIDRAEVLIHDRFGDSMFWKSRRSMRFAEHLREIGDTYRLKYLESTDEADKTEIDEDWTKMEKKHGDAKGGPYLAVHLRRKDFVKVRSKDIPSLFYAAEQIEFILKDLKLKKVFIATDAPKYEYEELKSYLSKFEVFRYTPSKQVKKKYKDGGIAIIDQWIAAHARHFIGSKESTFSFRIQDEREILGFKSSTTFNRLCNENDEKCEQPSKWKIVY